MLCDEHGIGLDGRIIRKQAANTEIFHNPFFSHSSNGKYSPRAIFVDTDPALINELGCSVYKDFFNSNQLIGGKESCASNVYFFLITIKKIKTNLIFTLKLT